MLSAVTSKAVATLPLTAAVAQPCRSAGMHRSLGEVAVLHLLQFCRAVELQRLIGVVAMMSKAVATLPLQTAVQCCKGYAQVSGQVTSKLLCITSAVLQGCSELQTCAYA